MVNYSRISLVLFLGIFLGSCSVSKKDDAPFSLQKNYPYQKITWVPIRGGDYCADWWNQGAFDTGCSLWGSFRFSLYTLEPAYGGWGSFRKTKLKEKDLQTLKIWRNIYGRPFSMFAMETHQTLQAKKNYSVRFFIGSLFLDEVSRKVMDEAQMGYATDWSVKNLSELGAFGTNFSAELFAWYTSPDYDGTIPPALERLLEKMVICIETANCGHGNEIIYRPNLEKEFSHFQPFWADALEQAQQFPNPNNEPKKIIASGDDQIFLYILGWQKYHKEKWPSINSNWKKDFPEVVKDYEDFSE